MKTLKGHSWRIKYSPEHIRKGRKGVLEVEEEGLGLRQGES